jgi:hypothetical protein
MVVDLRTMAVEAVPNPTTKLILIYC